jgi:transposase-like protein
MELQTNHGDKQMDKGKDTVVEAILEQLIETGPTDIASVFARAFELAMRIERERFLRAGRYERTPERQGYANGFKPKRVDTPAGTVTVQVPKTAGHGDAPFYPHSLERGRRSVRAVMLAVAEMYIKGVSTRDVEAVMAEFGVVCLSSSQVSRAARLLDEELAARAATAHSARSSISSSTPGTRRCAMAGSCAMVRRARKRSGGSFSRRTSCRLSA